MNCALCTTIVHAIRGVPNPNDTTVWKKVLETCNGAGGFASWCHRMVMKGKDRFIESRDSRYSEMNVAELCHAIGECTSRQRDDMEQSPSITLIHSNTASQYDNSHSADCSICFGLSTAVAYKNSDVSVDMQVETYCNGTILFKDHCMHMAAQMNEQLHSAGQPSDAWKICAAFGFCTSAHYAIFETYIADEETNGPFSMGINLIRGAMHVIPHP